jgi:hypothetical protein
MKFMKALIPVVLVLAVAACAKPPQADIDAARTAVAAAAKNADIVAYAADTLKSAQDKLALMGTELAAKHYDKVKSLALDARALAETAAKDAVRNKEKVKADAATLIEALKKALPDVGRKLAAAKRVRGIKLDFGAITSKLNAAKTALAEADRDLSEGSYAAALQKASDVQAQLSDGEKSVSDAVQKAASRKK